MPRKKYKYISRHADGYQLRLEPTAFFAFGVHGGIGKALDAAIRERYIRLAESGELYALKGKIQRPMRRLKNSQTGVIGVEFSTDWRYDDWGKFRAVGMINGQGQTRSFAIRKWGKRAAFRKACNARYARMGPLQIVCQLAELPCVPCVPYELNWKPTE